MDIDEIVDSFDFLDGWEDRYRFIIDLGRELPPLDEAERTDTHKVRGCQSQVWMVATTSGEPSRLHVTADSDAHIVKGLIAILLAIYNDKTPAEILAIEPHDHFAKLDLESHLSMTRRNGLHAMIQRIQAFAQEHATA